MMPKVVRPPRYPSVRVRPVRKARSNGYKVASIAPARKEKSA